MAKEKNEHPDKINNETSDTGGKGSVGGHHFRGVFHSLEDFAEAISIAVKNPVTIEDANHKLLAYSTHKNTKDAARIATIIGRRVPENVINSLWHEGIIQRLAVSEEPVRVPSIDEVGLGSRVAVSIRKNQDVLGYIWVLETEVPLGAEELGYLKEAAIAATTKLLQLQMGRKKEQESRQEFFWEMLTGHLKDLGEIREKAERLNLFLPPSFAVAVFQFSEEIDEKTGQNISYTLSTEYSHLTVMYVTDRKHLILLTGPRTNRADWQDALQGMIFSFAERMKSRFGAAGITGGTGSTCQSYDRVKASFQEALTVLKVKSLFSGETKEICRFHDLGIYRFLPLMAEQDKSAGYFNERLEKLKAYDRKNNSNLVETLEAYLQEDNNIHAASRRLHIHTNSLNYRLKRISEIAEINLNDPLQKITLFIDLKLDKLS